MLRTVAPPAAVLFGWHPSHSSRWIQTASNRILATFFIAVIAALPRHTIAATVVRDSYLRGLTTASDEGYVTLESGAPYVLEELEEQASGVLPGDLLGVFLVKEIEYASPSQGDRPDQTENIELPDGRVFEIQNGQWDDLPLTGSDMILIPAGSVISSSGTIDVMGEHLSEFNEEIMGLFRRNIQEDSFERTPEQQGNIAAHSGRKLQKGRRTVLAVRVLLNNGGYNYTPGRTGLSNDIFGNGVDPHNLKSQYAACSYGKLNFEKVADRAMTVDPNDGTTDINNGVVDIKVDLNMEAGNSAIRNAVTTKINSVFDVTRPDKLANHVMYCMPSGAMINKTAYAYVNSWNSVFNNKFCNMLSAQMHEIGHNLGYGHSNEKGSYKDQTCIMGYSYPLDDGPLMCFNSAKSWQSSWYTDKSRIVQAGDCFEGNLYGIADYNDTASSVVLVKMNDTSANDTYVTYNRKSGINNGAMEAGNQVTVTRAGGEGTRYAESELLAKLNVGGTWSGIISGKSMTVNVQSIDTTLKYARVRISENGVACPVLNAPTERPSASASPTSSGGPSSAPSDSTGPTASGEPTSRPTQTPTTREPTTRRPNTRPPTTRRPNTRSPTRKPVSRAPTHIPTQKPTSSPSASSSSGPTSSPSTTPTVVQTSLPTDIPTQVPSPSPTSEPSASPSTLSPTPASRVVPFPGSGKETSAMPTTLKPKARPSSSPIKGSKSHKTQKKKYRQPLTDKKGGKL